MDAINQFVLVFQENEGHLQRGVDYLMSAARFNDVSAMVQIAKAFENGYYSR
jgi:hypothetical protein